MCASSWRLRFSSSNGRVPVYLLHAGHDTLKFSSIILPPLFRAMLCATSHPDGRRQHTVSPHISHLPEEKFRSERTRTYQTLHRSTACPCELPTLATCETLNTQHQGEKRARRHRFHISFFIFKRWGRLREALRPPCSMRKVVDDACVLRLSALRSQHVFRLNHSQVRRDFGRRSGFS